MEMSFGPEIESVCDPVNPLPKMRINALVPRAIAPPTFDAEIVEAPSELTPSNFTLNADAVFGTRMLMPLVACPFATVITCGVVRLPPAFEVPVGGGGAVGVVGVGGVGVVEVVLEEPPPQPIQQTVRSTTGRKGMRML